MNGRDKETIKLAANMPGNVTAVALGDELFEHSPLALSCSLVAGFMAFIPIRSL